MATVPIGKGEPILLGKLAPEGAAAGLGALLRSDKLAVSVRTDDVTGVAGFLHPGEHVDVMVEMPVPDSKEHMSKIILQDIVVLSTGQKWEQNAEKKPQVVTTVTLELSPGEAEIINLASKQGKIHLALRSQQNKAKVVTAGISTSELLKGRGLPVVSNQFAAPPPDISMLAARRPARSVQVIKGTEVTVKNFN